MGRTLVASVPLRLDDVTCGACHSLGFFGSCRWYSLTLLTRIKTYICCWSMCPDCSCSSCFIDLIYSKPLKKCKATRNGARISWIHPPLFVLSGNLILMSQRQCWQMLAPQQTLWVSVGGSGPTSGLQHLQLPEHNLEIWFDSLMVVWSCSNPM